MYLGDAVEIGSTKDVIHDPTCLTVEPPLEHKPLPTESESKSGSESQTTKRVDSHHPVGEELRIDEKPEAGERLEVNGEDSVRTE